MFICTEMLPVEYFCRKRRCCKVSLKRKTRARIRKRGGMKCGNNTPGGANMTQGLEADGEGYLERRPCGTPGGRSYR